MRSFGFDDSWDGGADGCGSCEALVLMTAGMMVQTVMVHEKLWAGMMVVTGMVHEKLWAGMMFVTVVFHEKLWFG